MNAQTHADDTDTDAVTIEVLIYADGAAFDAATIDAEGYGGLSRTGPWGSVHSQADADELHAHGDAPRIIRAEVPNEVAERLENYADGNTGPNPLADGYEAADLLADEATDGPEVVWPEHVAGMDYGSLELLSAYYDDAERAECLACGHVAQGDPTAMNPRDPAGDPCPNCREGDLVGDVDAYRAGYDAAELCDDEGATADDLEEWADLTEDVGTRGAFAFADGVRAYAEKEGA